MDVEFNGSTFFSFGKFPITFWRINRRRRVLTFTAVDTTADFMEAKVFYSVLGTPAERARAAEELDKMRWELTRSMRRLESLNRIPHFHFIYDDTPSRAARVHDLIEKAHTTIRNPPPPPPNGVPSASLRDVDGPFETYRGCFP
jgi:ribosome-binding factor A